MNKDIGLADLVKVETIQKIQDAFSEMTGIAALTTDIDGVPVTRGSNFPDFCMKYTRGSRIGGSRCEKCVKFGAEMALCKGKAITYFCHAGLVDFAAPIMAGDKMVGCFIGGQVLTQPPDEHEIRELAKEIGVNPDEYVAAINKIKIVPRERIDKAAEFLYTIAGVLSDITYSRYQVRRANEEIERANNMKSDFLANMSHEIRTPMNAVIGMAEMALREDLPDNAREYINEIKSAGKSLLTIINDILDFSKIESGKMDIIPVEYEPLSIINDVTNIIMTRLDDKNVKLVLDITPDIPRGLVGDIDRIKQIILNILNNAVKFTKEGQIVFGVDFEKESDDQILLKIVVEDTGIGIKQEDLVRLFQSFQQLDSKRNRNIEGTGLGLAIVHQLLELMGGKVQVESEYERGSKFTITIPQEVVDYGPSITIKSDKKIVAASIVSNDYVRANLQKTIKRLGAQYVEPTKENYNQVDYLFIESKCMNDELRKTLKECPNIEAILVTEINERILNDSLNMRIIKNPVSTLNIAMIFNNENVNYDYREKTDNLFEFVAPEANILIVDDNAINLTVAEGLLEPLKMKIDTVLSGKEAIDKITNKKYDIIFMDHMMPELDGVETTQIIRRSHPEYDDVPIIALTANAVEGTMEMFLKEGMNDFVAKPIELRILVSRVKRWLPTEKIQKVAIKEVTSPMKECHNIPKIEKLDVASAMRLVGTEKLFWSVLKDYYRVIETKSTVINNYKEAGNWRAYTIEVHALKSASRQIGADSLADKAAALEKAGNENDIDFICKNTDTMLQEYRDYIPILGPFFVEEKKSDEKLPAVTKDVLMELFEEFKTGLDELDTDVMESVIDKMKKYSYPGEQKDLFDQIKDAVDNIDIGKCEEIIEYWSKI